MSQAPPAIFDRALLRSRRSRRGEDACRFVAGRAAEEIKDRLLLIKRDFRRAVICGPFAEWVAPLLGLKGPVVEGRDLVLDEEALPFADESLDLIVSVLSLQTVNDIPGALAQMRRVLRPDGLLLACLFAGESLKELRAAWLAAETDMRGGASFRVAPMVDLRELGGLLQRAGFALPVVDMDRTAVRYPTALALMREIKSLGLANAMAERSRIPVTPGLLARAAAAYGAGERVTATIDIAWVTAWAPHESQQKPLKPGSAKARLADALNATEWHLREQTKSRY